MKLSYITNSQLFVNISNSISNYIINSFINITISFSNITNLFSNINNYVEK